MHNVIHRGFAYPLPLVLVLASSVVAQTEVWSSDGDHVSDTFGTSTAAIGDLNGDGIPDLLAGAPGGNGIGPNSGWVRALSGADGSEIWTSGGGHHSEVLGVSVARIDDLDGDGIDDVLAGGLSKNTNTELEGRIRVLSGATGSLIFLVDGVTPAERLGYGLAGIHDWNGDGTPDFVAGAPGNHGFLLTPSISGRAVVCSGADGSILHEWTDDLIGGGFGWSVSGIGDANGDGVPDVAIGSPGRSDLVGRIFIFSGADGSEIWSLEGEVGDRTGMQVTGIEDLNGDGIHDVLCGAAEQEQFGMVFALSGADGETIYTLQGLVVSQQFGFSLSGAGDVDGDGVSDIVASGPSIFTSPKGIVSVFSGADGSAIGVLQRGFPTGSNSVHFGYSVSVLGDVSGDGLADVAVGIPYARSASQIFGKVTVFSLPAAAGLNVTVSCDPANAHYAGGPVDLSSSSMTPAGDVHLEARGGPPGEFGFFLIGGSASGSTSLFSGILCLDSQLARFDANVALNQGRPQLNSTGRFDDDGVLENLSGTSTSGFGFDVPLDLPFSPPQTVLSGETWSYQLWYRDQIAPLPNPGSSANFSNVVTVTFP